MSCHSLTINRMGLVPEHAGYPVPAHFIGPSTGVPSIQHVLQQTQSSIFICITKKRLSYHQNMVGLSSLCLLVWLYRLTHQSSPIAGLSVPTAGWSNPSRLLVSYILYSYIPSSSHHMSSSHFIYCLHPEEKKTLLVCSNIISYNVRPPSYKLVQITPMSLWFMVLITIVTAGWGPQDS